MSGAAGIPRLPLERAEPLARELVDRITPACQRIEVAGSIRRRAPDVGDIEIVAIPRVERRQRTLEDLFGTVEEHEVNCLDELCDQMLAAHELEQRLSEEGRKTWGSGAKYALYRDFALDIFTATPETWGVIFTLRTGPARFSHRLVTPKAYQGLCPSDLQFKEGRVVRRADGTPLETPEEEDVFRVLGYQYVPPQKRWFATTPEQLAA